MYVYLKRTKFMKMFVYITLIIYTDENRQFDFTHKF